MDTTRHVGAMGIAHHRTATAGSFGGSYTLADIDAVSFEPVGCSGMHVRIGSDFCCVLHGGAVGGAKCTQRPSTAPGKTAATRLAEAANPFGERRHVRQRKWHDRMDDAFEEAAPVAFSLSYANPPKSFMLPIATLTPGPHLFPSR